MKPATNTGGRPRGSRTIDKAALIAMFNRNVTPHAEAVLQLAMGLAIEGHSEALSAVLGLIEHFSALPDAQPAKPASCAACSP
jgi:hypothetical protein